MALLYGFVGAVERLIELFVRELAETPADPSAETPRDGE